MYLVHVFIGQLTLRHDLLYTIQRGVDAADAAVLLQIRVIDLPTELWMKHMLHIGLGREGVSHAQPSLEDLLRSCEPTLSQLCSRDAQLGAPACAQILGGAAILHILVQPTGQTGGDGHSILELLRIKTLEHAARHCRGRRTANAGGIEAPIEIGGRIDAAADITVGLVPLDDGLQKPLSVHRPALGVCRSHGG